MQQYFCDTPLKVGDLYYFTKEQAHHAGNVLHLNHERVRLVYDGRGFFADCYEEGSKMVGKIIEEDSRINESPIRTTLAIALIRKEKFEFILQKATELGVNRIVPFESSRCVVRAKKEKAERQNQRWMDIVQSASEQCKRNQIPEVTEIVPFQELENYCSGMKICAYENASTQAKYLSDIIKDVKEVTIVIGPEGGFSDGEIEQLRQKGFFSCTLGSRILRAETAAIYALSVISEISERSMQ